MENYEEYKKQKALEEVVRRILMKVKEVKTNIQGYQGELYIKK